MSTCPDAEEAAEKRYPRPEVWIYGLAKSRPDRIGSRTINLRLWYRMNGRALTRAVTMSLILQACAIAPPPPLEHKPTPVADQSAKVRDLRKQIRERERRIEELESQLEALKLIDQDSKNQKPLLRPSTTLPPPE